MVGLSSLMSRTTFQPISRNAGASRRLVLHGKEAEHAEVTHSLESKAHALQPQESDPVVGFRQTVDCMIEDFSTASGSAPCRSGPPATPSIDVADKSALTAMPKSLVNGKSVASNLAIKR
jgi:hypothetical protein